MLPQIPEDYEKYVYFDQGRKLFYSGGLISFGCLFAGMLLFAKQSPAFYWYFGFAFLSLVYFSISYFIGLFGKDLHKGLFDTIIEYYKKHPSNATVDIYLPSAGEDLTILENTFKHVAQIDYRYKTVFVLDDSRRKEVEELARKYNFAYITRSNNAFKKAGNLRNAFTQTSAEFILILDADFVPRPDILDCMLPYMKNPKVAIVQSPQFFEIQGSWVEKGSAYVQEIFYRLVQPARDTWCNGAICVGTCALYRRKALEPFGGTAEIGHSEDVHTGFNCVSLGYDVKYTPVILSKGLCPDTVASFFNQQKRWCMGSMSLLFSKKFWCEPNVNWKIRMCYLSGMLYYIFTALSVLLYQVPSVLMVWMYPEYVTTSSVMLSMPSFIFGTFWLAFWSRAPWGVYALQARFVQGWAHVFSICEKLTGNISQWIPTGNARVSVARFRIVAGGYTAIMWGLFTYPVGREMLAGNYTSMVPLILITFFTGVSLSTVFSE